MRLRELDLSRGRRSERGPLRRRARRGVDDLGARMSEQERAPALHQVDVPLTVDVDQVGALAAIDEHGRAADASERANGGVHAAGDHAARAIEQLLGPRHGADGSGSVVATSPSVQARANTMDPWGPSRVRVSPSIV